jgi:sugar lactone lactonase YvrE
MVPLVSSQRLSHLHLAAAVVVLAGCAASQTNAALGSEVAGASLATGHWSVVATLPRMPSGLAQAADGRLFVACPQWVERGPTLFELVDGELVPWPPSSADAAPDSPAPVSVNGIHIDSANRLWVVDNARVDLRAPTQPPEVFVYDLHTNALLFHREFDAEVSTGAGVFFNDIAVFEELGVAVFSESGLGSDPALVVWDYVGDQQARWLAGHASVQAQPEHPVRVGDEAAQVQTADGPRPWLIGLNGITRIGQTLYFGATSSETLWSLDVVQALQHEGQVEPVEATVERPLFDGIAATGTRVWMTDLQNLGLAWWDSQSGEAATLAGDIEFAVAVEPLADGSVLVSEGQFHRLPLLGPPDCSTCEDRRQPPYRILRWTP